jgi:Uma2 family endonuclease
MFLGLFPRSSSDPRPSTIMTTEIQTSEPPAIEYPESDGLPIADSTLQFRWIGTIMWGLDALFSKNPDVFVAADLLWYPVEGAPTIRTGPDVLVAFGRPKGDRRSYQQWNEGNVAPQVVFEVLSHDNLPGAMDEKFQFYERYGVEEYYIYDPHNGPLLGWVRVVSRLEEVPRMVGFVSPRLKIRFEPGEGCDQLRIFGPDGARFLTPTELVLKTKADQRRADEHAREMTRLRVLAERGRAEEARQRADAAEERTARLRELGVEPE